MATVRYEMGRYPYPAAAISVPGATVLRPDGTLAIHDDLVACAVGELIAPDPLIPGPTVIFQKSVVGDVMAAGLVVYVIMATGLITATVGSNVKVGKVIQAAGAGVLDVHVNCVA